MNNKCLYLIGGPMGVGKTSVCRELQRRLNSCVFLDGDWCWDANPFIVTENTTRMVVKNVSFLLNNYLACPDYQNIVFCWVMHEQEIIDSILVHLDTDGCTTHVITLVCSEEALVERLEKDIAAGLRQPDIIERGLKRLTSCIRLDTRIIDTSLLTAKEIANIIAEADERGGRY